MTVNTLAALERLMDDRFFSQFPEVGMTGQAEVVAISFQEHSIVGTVRRMAGGTFAGLERWMLEFLCSFFFGGLVARRTDLVNGAGELNFAIRTLRVAGVA